MNPAAADAKPDRTMELDSAARSSVLEWATQKQTDATVTRSTENGWVTLRTNLLEFDAIQQLLLISYPMMPESGPPVEIPMGTKLGLAFRRGHKKCLFVSPVVMRRRESDPDGNVVDALVLRVPETIRALQRRAYQRTVIGQDRLVTVKLWEGGVPDGTAGGWPICSGRVSNISAGGVLVSIRTDQNPQLEAGDVVGLEIGTNSSGEKLLLDAQYRHCMMEEDDRLGLGFQFLALEHDVPGRASLPEVAEFVRSLRRRSR